MATTFTDLNKLNINKPDINSLNEVISLTVGSVGEISNGITVLNQDALAEAAERFHKKQQTKN